MSTAVRLPSGTRSALPERNCSPRCSTNSNAQAGRFGLQTICEGGGNGERDDHRTLGMTPVLGCSFLHCRWGSVGSPRRRLDRPRSQMRSMIVAVARAPPLHMVINAVEASRRSSFVQCGGHQSGSGTSHGMSEGDGAAVDVDRVHVGVVHAGPGQDDGGECLVDLEQVQIADLHSGLVEHPTGCLYRSVEVEFGFGADEALRDDPGTRRPGPVARRGCGPSAGNRSCAVGNLRRGSGGVYSAGNDRGERSKCLRSGLSQTLIFLDQRVGRFPSPMRAPAL